MAVVHPVVFIPGFPGSALVDAVSGKTLFPPPMLQTVLASSKKKLLDRLATDLAGVVAGDPITDVGKLGIAKQAESLYDNLRSFGYDTSKNSANFRPVGWDWRKGVDDGVVQGAIARAIDAFGRKVIVIIHSTGGLVFRAFLEKHPEFAPKIERVLAFAIPWAGTLDAFQALSVGVPLKFAIFGFNESEVQRLASGCQTAYDLCPPDPAETDMTNAEGSPIRLFVSGAADCANGGAAAGPLVSPAEWTADPDMQALAANARARFGVRAKQIALNGFATPPIVNICAWGGPTVDCCTLNDGQLAFRATDAKAGDTTIPFDSASWLADDGASVKAFYVPIGAFAVNAFPQNHPRIWDSPPSRELLAMHLDLAQPKPYLAAAVDTDDNFPGKDPVRIRVAAADANGRALPNARITLRIPPHDPVFPLAPDQRRLDIRLPRAALPKNTPNISVVELIADFTGGSMRTRIAVRIA